MIRFVSDVKFVGKPIVVYPPIRTVPLRPRTVQVAADGQKTAMLEISMPANAIVDKYELVVTANRANLVVAGNTADLRENESEDEKAVVVDFGTMRTVNGILLPTDDNDHKVYPWLGTKFDELSKIDLSNYENTKVDRGEGANAYSLFIYPIPEIRTERLKIVLGESDPDLQFVMDVLELSLPELPADLAIRVNGGSPVWEHQGAVHPGQNSELSEDEWTDQGQRIVSIEDALTEYTGDATNQNTVTLTVELTSSVPCALQLDTGDQSLRLLNRLNFNEQETVQLNYEEEGAQTLKLAAPEIEGVPTVVKGLQFNLLADLPLERVIPPVGPDKNDTSELILGKGRAACVRLDGGEKLSQLLAVRLPLESMSSSAEARIVLWNSDSNKKPLETTTDGVSEPVQLQNNGEHWVSFNFSEPLELDAEKPYWAALIVSRGEVRWSMAIRADGDDFPLLLGAAEGPWRQIPGALLNGNLASGVAGRVRLVGLAEEMSPLAPLIISVSGGLSDIEVTPSPDKQNIQIQAAAIVDSSVTSTQDSDQGAVGQGEESNASRVVLLQVVSRTPGEITLSEVDIITEL